ncbi:glyceraldehyde-3-phosphate dehydrogenase-like [Psammomys obesus]|uniref:glyceraldehyde-3-phosphate dehydrogenase-like n=1 Tax=Psammomys obesus TaxID=48139 RepID=UPI00245294E6|nr:glyceraldehyde-3-phosphate dehydrogenase-like [Psammomys obesus]
MATLIHDHVGIVEGLMTSVHAITATLKIVWMTLLGSCGVISMNDGCRVAQNSIPESIGTAKAVGNAISKPTRIHTGMVFHVSNLSVSAMDPTCSLEKAVKYNDIKKKVQRPSES